MQRNQVKNYFTIASLLSLAIGITIHFPMVMSYLFLEGEGPHGERFLISKARVPEFKSWFGGK
jgi:hypothetical protein